MQQENKKKSTNLWEDSLKTKLKQKLNQKLNLKNETDCDFKNGNIILNMEEYMRNFSEYKKYKYLRKSVDSHFDWEMEGFCGDHSEQRILFQWNLEKKMCRKLYYPTEIDQKVKYEWQCCGCESRKHKPHLEFFD